MARQTSAPAVADGATAQAGSSASETVDDPVDAEAQAEQERLYLKALRALDAGRPAEAAELLTHLIKTEPRHAGAWLDLAISECDLGNAVEAERLFKETERLFSPPPGIMEVINSHRDSGCKGLPVRPASWMLGGGRGHDSNVNQGASSPLFTTGSGLDQETFQLSPDFLPKADNYTALSGDYFSPLDNRGTLGILQFRGRWNDHVHEQNEASLLAGLERPWQWGSWRLRGTGSTGLVQLGGALYQRQAQLQLRVMPPLPLPEHYDLALYSGFSHVEYPSRSQYDANTAEFGSTLSYSGAHAQVQLSAGLLQDYDRAARPGGTRHGGYVSLQWNKQFSDRWSSEMSAGHQYWRSDQDYSPGLIDVLRHQTTDSARIALLYSLRPHQTILLEWRETRNRENISLFQYDSRSFQLSWRWDNF